MTLLEYVGLVGGTLIVTWSSLFEKIRTFAPKFLACPQCVGFWIGTGGGALLLPQAPRGLYVLGCILSGAAVSVGALVSQLVVDWLEEH